jgi:hypothetical protein
VGVIIGTSYKGVATERWTSDHRQEVFAWLTENFGESGGRWVEDQDYDFLNLIMEDDVYAWYSVRWA